MQDLEPPEVPLELMSQMHIEEPKKDVPKEGFFKRMFAKKDKSEKVTDKVVDNSTPTLPEINLPNIDLSEMEMPSMDTMTGNFTTITEANKNTSNSGRSQENMPVLPSISEQLEELRSNFSTFDKDVPKTKADSAKNKSKGKVKKGQNREINKVDISSQFDWNREIKDQEILVHDSNRFNQDVNLLITQADNHVDEAMPSTTNDIFKSEHQEITPAFEPLNIQDVNTSIITPVPEVSQEQEMPKIDFEQQKAFAKLSGNHQKIRSLLHKYLKNPKLFNNKAKVMALFKQYDDSVEKNIEEKEVLFTKNKSKLDRYEQHLKQEEKDIKNMHNYMKGLDDKLKDREENLNTVISTAVEKELSRRLKTEKNLLKEGLYETIRLNNDLKKKVKIIEDDRIRFEREHKRMSEMERKKLTELQTLYEKKLRELESERRTFNEEKKAFEEKRKNVLGLIKQADTVAKELDDLKNIKSYVDESKRAVASDLKTVEKELSEDRELKQAITAAEQSLAKEKENLDNMIFSRYIENKLRSIKPEYLQKRQDWKAELQSHPLYAQVSQCRKLLLQHNINEAKSLYNAIRKTYEQVKTSKKEKEALYNAIRELYNEIQLKIVEAQLHSK